MAAVKGNPQSVLLSLFPLFFFSLLSSLFSLLSSLFPCLLSPLFFLLSSLSFLVSPLSLSLLSFLLSLYPPHARQTAGSGRAPVLRSWQFYAGLRDPANDKALSTTISPMSTVAGD